MRIEVHNVGYGECIVLCGGDEILMSDCGSSNIKLPCGMNFTDYVKTVVIPRYAGCGERSFLLTHCHRDHSCGLRHILKLYPKYFDRIFLPAVPEDACGRLVLLEFALYVYVFLNRLTGYSKSNTEILMLFSKAAHAAGAECIFPVKKGDVFVSGGTEYEILWPAATGFPYGAGFVSAVENMDSLLKGPFMPDSAREFLQLKSRFCLAYKACQSAAPVSPVYICELDDIMREITAAAPNLPLLPCAPEIEKILLDSSGLYSETLNASSVIFQNIRSTGACSNDDVLMTGDAPPEVLGLVGDSLYGCYYAVKAPHHGTKSGFPPVLRDIVPPHIIISNGLYSGGGKISPEYAALQSVKHCTNCETCAFYNENGYCCDDFAVCYDMKKAPGLTIKCGERQVNAENPPCGITVISA